MQAPIKTLAYSLGRTIAGLALLSVLAACGYKGGLYMPPPPPPDESLTTPPPSSLNPGSDVK